MGRKRGNKNKYEPAAEMEGEKRRREDGLSPEEGVSGEAPALTIDERRAAAGAAWGASGVSIGRRQKRGE